MGPVPSNGLKTYCAVWLGGRNFSEANEMTFSPEIFLASVVDLDATFLIQWAIFLIFFLVVRALLWKPFLHVIEKRDHQIHGRRVEAEASEKEAKEREASYLEKYKEAQNSAVERRQVLLGKAQKDAQLNLDAARDAAAKTVAQAQEELEKQAVASREKLRAESTQMAQAICEQILRRKVTL